MQHTLIHHLHHPPQFKTVNPVGERVFIKVDTSDEVTIGGLVLPASAQKKPTQGKVVSAPKGKGVAVCDGKCVGSDTTVLRPHFWRHHHPLGTHLRTT